MNDLHLAMLNSLDGRGDLVIECVWLSVFSVQLFLATKQPKLVLLTIIL